MGDLSSANLIVTLDQESDQYTKTRKYYIRGEVRPIGMFLSAGSLPSLQTPLKEMTPLMRTTTMSKSYSPLSLVVVICSNRFLP